MNFDEMSPELQEKARACKSPEDIIALAKEEGYKLSDEELEAISGGNAWSCKDDCPDDCWKDGPCLTYWL